MFENHFLIKDATARHFVSTQIILDMSDNYREKLLKVNGVNILKTTQVSDQVNPFNLSKKEF